MKLAGPPPSHAATPSLAWLDRVRSTPWMRDTQIAPDGTTLGAALEAAPAFALAGETDGVAPSQREFVPLTQGGRDLMAAADWQVVEQRMRGLLGTFDARAGLELSGFMFAATPEQETAQGVVTLLESGVPEGYGMHLDTEAPSLAKLHLNALISSSKHADSPGRLGGHSESRYVAFTPGVLMNLRDANVSALDGTDTLDVAHHELEHRVVPGTKDGLARHSSSFGWIEEGTATVLTQWPGVLRAAVERAGVAYDVPAVAPKHPYDPFVASLRTLLTEAGVDPGVAGNIDRARELLQTRPSYETFDVLAGVIGERMGLTPGNTMLLGRALGQSSGDPARVSAALERARTSKR